MSKMIIKNKKYNKVLEYILDNAKSIFGKNLVNITLGGSGSKNNIVDGWSDLDIYIIFNEFDIESIRKFNKIIEDIDIHVGTTYYTIDDIKSKNIDFKTFIMIYEKNVYRVNPTLYGDEIYEGITIDFEIIKSNDKINLINNLN